MWETEIITQGFLFLFSRFCYLLCIRRRNTFLPTLPVFWVGRWTVDTYSQEQHKTPPAKEVGGQLLALYVTGGYWDAESSALSGLTGLGWMDVR